MESRYSSYSELSCPYCQESCEDTTALRNHIDRVHSDYGCPTCGASFRTRLALEHHIETKHPYVCPECGDGFNDEYELDDHMASEHTADVYTRHPILKKLTMPLPWATVAAFMAFMFSYHGNAESKALLGVLLILLMFVTALLFPTDVPNNDRIDVYMKVFQVLLLPFLAFLSLAFLIGR